MIKLKELLNEKNGLPYGFKKNLKKTQKLLGMRDFQEYMKSTPLKPNPNDVSFWLGFIDYLMKKGKIR